MSFEAKDYQINDILNKSVFQIPRNQRRYVWDKTNWQEFWEDIVNTISGNCRQHFMGSIVLNDDGKKDGLNYYTIIDGQQRLTTITILIIALLKVFKEFKMNDDFLGTLQYVIAKNNKNQMINIIDNEYHGTLTNLISGISEIEESMSCSAFINTNTISPKKDKVIGSALQFFYNVVKADIEKVDNKSEHLIKIRDAVIEIVVVKIVSSSEEDSYTIFEILNARGQELEDHELLKNYIMRFVHPHDKRDEAKRIWEEIEGSLGNSLKRFTKHYSTHRFGNSDKKESVYRIIQKNTKFEDKYVLLKDMALKAKYYKRIIDPMVSFENKKNSKLEREIFSFFKKKRFEQFRPVLLSLMHQQELEKITVTDYENTLKYIYNFFVCYNIIGMENSNKMEDVVYKYAKILENDYSKEKLKELCIDMKKKIPSFEWFFNAFKNVGWSKFGNIYSDSKNKERVKTVLEIIEKFLSQEIEIGEFTIEHIFPDSENIKNAKVGNLIPLEEALNENGSSLPPEEKTKNYQTSKFATARNMAIRINSGNFDIDLRTKFLARLIYNNILQFEQIDFKVEEI